MEEEIMLTHAREVFATLCRAIENGGWHYDKMEQELAVYFRVQGEDVPMQFVVRVDPERQLVRLMSPLPFKMSEARRMEGAIAACVASYGLPDGSFDYDLADGEIAFRMTASYRESQIGEGLFHYMLACSCVTVDKFNEKFLAIDSGSLSLADFIAGQN